ncbi:MAG: type II toxin-antitoxin system VapC family toxin [bacterium]|nr:type II toxin-antitoxin system VapC family toxin [bacterium]MDE0668151.1 type II toxin-antitoxin system VapC family toxin [bacterium]MXZ31729.1 type II toxin-antitoxin system VapC family toxin [Acidimicrobiia bacterium]MYB24207.1 type II toxin-antitoxin system VapC family toxin [Acidimicrobiia bacterium]
MIVVDSGVVFTLVAGAEPAARRAALRVGDEDMLAPQLVDLEVVSVLRRLVVRGDLPLSLAAAGLRHLAALDLIRVDHGPLLQRCWELRHNLTPYDAAYVALAETLGAPLLTIDRRLAGASGPHCPVEVLT